MKKILVPIDSIDKKFTSKAVDIALQMGSKWGKNHDPMLFLLHVLKTVEGLPQDLREKERELEKQRIEREFGEIKDRAAKRGIKKVKTLIKERNPVDPKNIDVHIVKVAEKENADMIIMGSGKVHAESVKGKLRKFIYGSTTEKVLHETPCSILLAKDL